jgi:hypothetical protein
MLRITVRPLWAQLLVPLAFAPTTLAGLPLSLSQTKSGWQVRPNRAMLLPHERSLQPGLVGTGVFVPVAGLVES